MGDDFVVSLSDDDWMLALSGLVLAAHGRPGREGQEYARVGRLISEQAPQGSGAWFGAALFPPEAS